MARVFFPDNTVLINFAHINRLQMLPALIPQRQWCNTVATECARSSGFPGLASLSQARAIFGPPLMPTQIESTNLQVLRTRMAKPRDLATAHVGEAETITIITERKIEAIFATDDNEARRFATSEGIPVLNTWDLLRVAHRMKHISVADAYADAVTLRNLGRGWPPCEPNLIAFTAWITS